MEKKCSKCGEGVMMLRNGKYGDFMACSEYPECKYTEQIAKEDIKTVKISAQNGSKNLTPMYVSYAKDIFCATISKDEDGPTIKQTVMKEAID